MIRLALALAGAIVLLQVALPLLAALLIAASEIAAGSHAERSRRVALEAARRKAETGRDKALGYAIFFGLWLLPGLIAALMR